MRIVLFTFLAFFSFQNLYAGRLTYLKNSNLRTINSLYNIEDKAMLHSCGFTVVAETKEGISSKEIKKLIFQQLKQNRPFIKSISFNHDKISLKALSSYSMLPGWPSLDSNLVEYFIEILYKELGQWQQVQKGPLEDFVFEGVFFNEFASYNFYTIFDQPNNQLFMAAIGLEGEYEDCHGKF